MAALALLLSVIVAPVHAQDVFNNWNSTSNTSWGTATNWTQGTVPNDTSTIAQIGTAARSIAVAVELRLGFPFSPCSSPTSAPVATATAQYAKPFSIRELFERAASIKELSGIDLVGTWNISPATAKEVAGYLKDSGLTLVSIAPDLFASPEWGKGSLSSVDPKVRQAALDQIRQTMDLTAELGCDLLTIWPGQDGFDYPFQADYLTERDWFAEGIAKACAHNPKMKIAMEYKIKEPRTHSYISSVATALLLIQEVGAANLGVALDYGHALMGYENGAESVALLKRHGDRLFHVHINDNYRHWDDDLIVGSVHTIEFLEFFHWLDRTGYDGWLTIDQFPYREDGRDAVAESAAWMSALMDTAEKMDRKELDDILANKSAVQGSRLLRKTLLGRA